MVCPTCRRWIARDAAWCRNCGAALRDDAPELRFVLGDGTHAAAAPGTTLGRQRSSTLRLSDPSVSRAHARVTGTAAEPAIEDVGSTSGTWADGRPVGGRPLPLRDGMRLRLGDAEVAVERVRDARSSGRTYVVPAHATSLTATAAGGDDVPRLRPGSAFKRLEAGEGARRWVLQDPQTGAALRLDDASAGLVRLLDGERSMVAILQAAEDRLGPEGPARLAVLLAELADRGLLDGVAAAAPPTGAARWRSVLAPHALAWSGAADAIDALYRRGGWRLVSEPGIVGLAAVAFAGLIAFITMLAGDHGEPFVVANSVGLGGIVFVVGRFLVAGVHETAHGLALAACGRRVRAAGLKLVLVFPYVYVDTSEAWLEPARRRIAVTAAGPASDLVVGGAFAVMALASAPGVFRDVLYQLAVGAYLGAVFNLNPFVERDGYHILVDVLRQPGLRARAREALVARAHGAPVPPVLWRYGLFGLGWSIVAAALVIAISLRTAEALRATLPDAAVGAGLAATWALLLAPIGLLVVRIVRRGAAPASSP